MLSFQKFVDKRSRKGKKKTVPAWKHAIKYSQAAWTLFGVTVHPDGPGRVRVDTLQGRLRIRVAKMQAQNPGNETLANINTLVNDRGFINTFYTDSPLVNSRRFAERQFRGISETRAWTEMFPDEFFSQTYTDEIGTVQTYGAPIKTTPVKYMLGETMAYCMMQELFEYRRRFETNLYQNRLFAEMDLMFADTILHPSTARVYDLNGTVYILFGEIHTPASCFKRSLNAITTGKLFIDLVAACPDVRFDMFVENGPKTYMPGVPRKIQSKVVIDDDDEVEVVESSGSAGAGSAGAGSSRDGKSLELFEEHDSCQDRFSYLFQARKKGLLEGRTLEDINAELKRDGVYDPEWDDDGAFSSNQGFLSASSLYFFTAYPTPHAWKSKGLLGNVRLHNEDVRSRDGKSREADVRMHENARIMATNPRLAPLLDSIRELQLDRTFLDPQLKLTLDDVRSVNFQDLTITFRREDAEDEDPTLALLSQLLGNGRGGGGGGGIGGEIADFLRLMRGLDREGAGAEGTGAGASGADADRAKLEEEKQKYLAAGCKFVSATKDTITVTFEHILMKKFQRLSPDMQTRLQNAFQRFSENFNQHTIPPNMLPMVLEALVSDFYAMTRSFIDSSGGEGRKRVVMFQGGAAHVETWSGVLHAMGAREFVYGNPKDPLTHLKIGSMKRVDAVNLDAFRQRLIALDVLQPRMEFTNEERRLVRRIYNVLDSIKSSVVRADTFEHVWTLFDKILEPDNGLFRELIRTVHAGSALGESDGRTTNNRPFEVLALVGTKVKFALEMFIVDLTTLQRTTNTESVLTKARHQMSDQKGTLFARVQQLQRAASEGVLVAKRKNES